MTSMTHRLQTKKLATTKLAMRMILFQIVCWASIKKTNVDFQQETFLPILSCCFL